MTWPGPEQLGRGVVVAAGSAVPAPWREAPVAELDAAVLADPDRRGELVDRLHRAWVARKPTVVVWEGPDDLLAERESEPSPPWRLDAGFLFPLERLRFLCFSNNYDARSGEPKWWWSVKAQRRIGATPGGGADVVLPDGAEAWIDGGPRHPLPDLGSPVVHGESVDVGSAAFVPVPGDVSGDGLADDQREAVAHLRGPARIIAPAGSGKTRTLTARVRHVLDRHGVEPGFVTAVAYNERAANELRTRLEVGPALARTIHSLGWEILREARPGVELLDERGTRDTIDAIVSIPKRANADPVGPYLEALGEVRSRLRDPAEVEMSRDDVPGFGDAFEAYRERLYRMGRVDYGEQIYGAIEALLRHPGLRERWQHRCRHLLVDEFQDLTPAFVLLLRLLASPQLSVFGVGDDDQVIYGFDGADPGFLIDFDAFFPGAGVHALHTNYRCSPAVVGAAVNLLSHNRRRIDKTIAPARSDEDPDALAVDRRPGAELALAAADRIVGWIEDGTAPAEIAVLTRVNSSLIPVKAALVARGVPTVDLIGADAVNRTVVWTLLSWMRVAARPERMRRSDVLAAVRRPGRGLTRLARDLLQRSTLAIEDVAAATSQLDGKQYDRWEGFVADLEEAAEVAAGGDAGALIDHLTDVVGLGGSAKALDSGRGNASRSGHLDDLVAVRRAAALHPDLADFERWLRDVVATPSQPAGVVLSSVHRVKGMEWPNVIVFGADEGAMPHDLSDDLEEERRVFHVALTRGIRRVAVLADAGRPSRFLRELERAATPEERARVASPEQARAKPTAARVVVGDEVRVWGGHTGEVVDVDGDRLRVRVGASVVAFRLYDIVKVTRRAAVAGEASADLVDALKTWRRDKSQRLGVPAYVIFSDATLDEIARLRPATESELLSISGIGPAKLDQHGDEILGIVADAE